jgi:cobyrinic acid a,c-diamide synthase
VTAALARRYRDRGVRVRVFKIGPDFLDPTLLEWASGHPVYQLDLWMVGEQHCRELLFDAAGEADLILIEGVMGLYDGEPSSADLAARFGIPVLAVIDASAMAQTFGAVAFGLARYRSDVAVAGFFANRVAGEGHASMLSAHGVPLMGWLPRQVELEFPFRHLGLVQAKEVDDLDARLANAAAALQWREGALPQAVEFAPTLKMPIPPLLANRHIAVAQDAAFSFLYRANLDLLRALGAELSFFSPLIDSAPPPADAIYLPGGYPELHLSQLSNNHSMRNAIQSHHLAGKPIVAECGGMLYLMESLAGVDGHRAPMLGLLQGDAVMQRQLTALALQQIELPQGPLRGHTFHHSRLDTNAPAIAHGTLSLIHI